MSTVITTVALLAAYAGLLVHCRAKARRARLEVDQLRLTIEGARGVQRVRLLPIFDPSGTVTITVDRGAV